MTMASDDPNEFDQVTNVFLDILDSLIVDVASEAHRAAHLGFDHRLNMEEEEEMQLSAQARATMMETNLTLESGAKYVVDVFGQSHPAVANEMFECMNCARPVVAGRFAPHLEKCMGKGRKARVKANQTIISSQLQRVRNSSVSSNTAIRSSLSFASEALDGNCLDVNNSNTSEESEDMNRKTSRTRSRNRQGQKPSFHN